MLQTYPYIISNNKIKSIFEKIQTAAKPSKFTHEFLKRLGFNSSNDRAMIPILKTLGFLTEDGTPTEYYDRLKDSADHPYVLGERIRELYKDLFTINTEIYKASDQEIRDAISRTTGREVLAVKRYAATFKSLVALAKFDSPSIEKQITSDEKQITSESEQGDVEEIPEEERLKADFHYNIQIHLPATTDITVYNKIFKSLRDNLLR